MGLPKMSTCHGDTEARRESGVALLRRGSQLRNPRSGIAPRRQKTPCLRVSVAEYLLWVRLGCLVLAMFCVLLPVTAQAEFWASQKSQKYHKPSCRWVAQITPEYRVKFATKDAAWAAGYKPCEVCRPPGFDLEPQKKRMGKKLEAGKQ
jgi:Metal binding domain of Ada